MLKRVSIWQESAGKSHFRVITFAWNTWRQSGMCRKQTEWFHVDHNDPINRLQYERVLDRLHKISRIWAYRCSRPMKLRWIFYSAEMASNKDSHLLQGNVSLTFNAWTASLTSSNLDPYFSTSRSYSTTKIFHIVQKMNENTNCVVESNYINFDA